tara:strand:- start:84 stop:587 length:504 start_codon:yes stop_codon:yes gene_type:complete
MGTDVYSESGIIAGIDEMVGLIRKKDLKTVIDICENKSLESLADLEPLKTINKKSTIEEVREALFECVKVHGEPAKYGSDECYLENEYAVAVLWGEILSETRPTLPSLNEVRIFDSPRYNGWDVPLGEACFIFNSSDCFIRTLSEEGKALKRAIGHCETTEWTIVSY